MHTNLINGKKYIGITGRTAKERWGSNGNGYYRNEHFYRAICKYGWENFKHEVLFENLSKEDAQNKERELIKTYNTMNSNYGYNHDYGGSGVGTVSDETRRKISEIHTGMRYSDETRLKCSLSKRGGNNPNYGKKLPEWHKQLLIRCNKGRKMSDAQKELLTMKRGYKTNQYDMSGKYLNTYRSVGEASRITGIHKSGIKNCCVGRNKFCCGYVWRYVKDGYDIGVDIEPIEKDTVFQYSMDMKLMASYKTMADAERDTGFDHHRISKAIKSGNLYKNCYWKNS